MAKMVFAIEQTAKNLITGTDKIVISSGKNFLQDWEKFKKEIGKKLEEINVKKSAVLIIKNNTKGDVNGILHDKFSQIMKPINKTLKQKVHNMMNYMARTELNQILENLKGENFFNLSGSPIDINVIKNLKFGKKFTPFCTFNIKKELATFENEINGMLDRIFGNQTNCRKTTPLFIKMRKMRKMKNFNFC